MILYSFKVWLCEHKPCLMSKNLVIVMSLAKAKVICGLSSLGGCSFLSTPQKGTQKVTAQGTGLPWLALRRRRGKLAHPRCAQTNASRSA